MLTSAAAGVVVIVVVVIVIIIYALSAKFIIHPISAMSFVGNEQSFSTLVSFSLDVCRPQSSPSKPAPLLVHHFAQLGWIRDYLDACLRRVGLTPLIKSYAGLPVCD